MLTFVQSFVVACGVRKVWSKEFGDITEDKRAQIRGLKEMLSGLGMTGRLSMEKAKAIKEKRELAQELGKYMLGTVIRRAHHD
jgi:hypothetical protein